jgi:rod shape determining protein RodA
MNRLVRLGQRLTTHLDFFLLGAIAVALLVGLVTLYSAGDQNFSRVTAQGMNILVALVVMWVAANIPPNHWLRIAVPLYVAGVLLLVAVALFGDVSKGARRWLNLGFMRMQPSEIMRIAVPLMLAWYFSRHEAELKLKNFAVAAIILLVPVGLIVKQPDLGTSLLISASGFYVLFLAGLSWRIMIGLALTGAAATPILWSLLHDYQRRRILTLIDPTSDPLGSGYHIIQSTIAIGSGGIIGKGWLKGTQTHLDFLPERHTDFIFAVYSEEYGLIGNFALLLLFTVIIGRSLYIAFEAPSLAGRLLAGAIGFTFFTYAFVNMGMVAGILPVVGVPLPLISYGGTSMVTLMLGFGILMSIHTHRKLVRT